MNLANLIWWAITGIVFSILIGVIGAVLAFGNGNAITGAIMVGAAAAGGFAGLWIGGTTAVHMIRQRSRDAGGA